MAETKKRAAPAEAAGKPETKAAAEFRRFKEAREAAASAAASGASSAGGGAATMAPPATGLPPWTMPPAFSLPPAPQGWPGMLPQPGLVQPAPQAVGGLGERLGSTLRLSIDVVNMALAGTLRWLGGAEHAAWDAHCCVPRHVHHHHGCDCCGVFGHDCGCTPHVGNCCD